MMSLQFQQDAAARIRNESANRTALAAIGRKRPAGEESLVGGASSSVSSSSEGGNASSVTSSLFAPLVNCGPYHEQLTFALLL